MTIKGKSDKRLLGELIGGLVVGLIVVCLAVKYIPPGTNMLTLALLMG
jgi:hypothetical protein